MKATQSKTPTKQVIRFADFGGNQQNINIAFSSNMMGFTRDFGEKGDLLLLTSSVNGVKYLLGAGELATKASSNPFKGDAYHCWHLINVKKLDTPVSIHFLFKDLLQNKYWTYFRSPLNISKKPDIYIPIKFLLRQLNIA